MGPGGLEVFMKEVNSDLGLRGFISRTSYITFRAQCKIKMQDPFSKNYEEFLHSNNRSISQV